MEKETARELLQALADAAKIAIDTQNRFIALESALKAETPALHEKYREFLSTLRPQTAFDPVAFSALLEKLIQH